MAQTGYGSEIIKIIDALPYEKLIQTEYVANQLAQRCLLPYDEARAAVNVKLKRIADKGNLRRIRKGVYCHVRQTVFGPVTPDLDHMIARSFMIKDGKRIGYQSGAGLLNYLGLSTLLPREIEITTNQYRSKPPDNCHIRLRKPVAAIADDNWKYLQFIDVVDCLPTAHIDAKVPEQLMKALAAKRGLEPLTLIFTAKRYYPAKTVLRLIDLLMEEDDKPA